MNRSTLVHLATALALVNTAEAAISITALGTDAPPTTFVPPGSAESCPLIPAIDDTSPVFSDVFSVPLAPGKNVLFDSAVSHREVGFGWGTWSHGYTGDVYYVGGDFEFTVIMTFDQPDMQAFYFYAEPETFGISPMYVTASSDDGAVQSITEMIDGFAGAKGFLIATDGTSSIASVTVSSEVTGFGFGFAVGEFGYAKSIPGPGALALLALAAFSARRRR